MYRAPGNLSTVWGEHVEKNPGSFASPNGEWLYTAVQDGMPARGGHRHDSTAYTTVPSDDSWIARINGTQSPTRPGGTSGLGRAGGLV